MEGRKQQRQHSEDQPTSFRTQHPSREALRRAPGSVQQASGSELSGIAAGIKVDSGPIEGSMKTDNEGDRAGAPDREACK